MSIEYCARGHHQVDTDYEEGEYIDGEFVCDLHLTNQELDELEELEDK